MRDQDLPESENVEDRRGETYKPGPKTLAEMAEQKRRAIDLTKPDATGQLPKDAGLDDIK